MNVKAILCDTDLCTGCGRCELWCSLDRLGSLDPSAAAIHVMRSEPGLDQAVTCEQCGACVPVCTRRALRRNKETGAITVNAEKCGGCGECVAVCPWGAIRLDEETQVAEKCELCGGDPLCVKHCPHDALSLADIDAIVRHRRLEALQA
jgi:anaerobic carbon-monoxide dehydrogenase iron sulfur subunit